MRGTAEGVGGLKGLVAFDLRGVEDAAVRTFFGPDLGNLMQLQEFMAGKQSRATLGRYFRRRYCPPKPRGGWWPATVELLGANVRRLDDFRPALDFGTQKRRELIRRAARRVGALPREAPPDLGQSHHLCRVGVEARDDVP